LQNISWRAQLRLCKRYRTLATKGKHQNQVTGAIARELAAFIWAIAKQTPLSA
jgi:transposase